MELTATNTIGIDVGDRFSEVCVLDGSGEVVETSAIRSTEEGFAGYFTGWQP